MRRRTGAPGGLGDPIAIGSEERSAKNKNAKTKNGNREGDEGGASSTMPRVRVKEEQTMIELRRTLQAEEDANLIVIDDDDEEDWTEEENEIAQLNFS